MELELLDAFIDAVTDACMFHDVSYRTNYTGRGGCCFGIVGTARDFANVIISTITATDPDTAVDFAGIFDEVESDPFELGKSIFYFPKVDTKGTGWEEV